MRIHFRISRYRFYHIIAQNPLRVRPFIKFIFMRDFLRKIHFNNNFIQAGIKSIFKLEFNKLFYYWQLINQWKSIALPIYNIFFALPVIKIDYVFSRFFFGSGRRAYQKWNSYYWLSIKKAEKETDWHNSWGGLVDNTRLIESINITLERKSFTSSLHIP